MFERSNVMVRNWNNKVIFAHGIFNFEKFLQPNANTVPDLENLYAKLLKLAWSTYLGQGVLSILPTDFEESWCSKPNWLVPQQK